MVDFLIFYYYLLGVCFIIMRDTKGADLNRKEGLEELGRVKEEKKNITTVYYVRKELISNVKKKNK